MIILAEEDSEYSLSLFLSPRGYLEATTATTGVKTKTACLLLSTPNVTHPLQAALPQPKQREGGSVRMDTTWYFNAHAPPFFLLFFFLQIFLLTKTRLRGNPRHTTNT